ncbi:MAG TPA: SgcJ/EcaC family oxidoreductase [Gemmataceae bacterium]|nr:SgcJ/EcaC family oxidoreductase [Gemmataceae bacterium]
MKVHLGGLLALTALISIGALRTGAGGRMQDAAKDEAAILKNAEAFVEAFQKGDAKAVAAFWTTDGDYTDQTGRVLKGQPAIEKAFTDLFAANKGLKVRIEVAGLRFLTPEVALEDGTTSVISPDGAPPTRARYSNVHVKKDGKWLLSSVRDAAFSAPTNFEHLSGLEWTVGSWATETDQGEVERLSFAWSENQNFLVSTFATTFKDISVASATQWIGWDPAAKNIRSWIFDADGGFGEGAWSKDGKKWIIKTHSILRDGKKATATYTIAPVDGDTLTLQGTERTVDGNALPDTKEFKLKRVK